MRWFWQRRKKNEPSVTAPAEREAPRGGVATAPRPAGSSGRLAGSAEPRDELLRFARDLLNAQGARVRAEDDDLIVATLPDGAVARYTTTLARARAEEETILLAQGAAALQTLFDEAADRSRSVALRLPESDDPVALALRLAASLTWAQAPTTGRVRERIDAESVELSYRLIGRDRNGRRDEWLRLAFDDAGHALPPLTLDQLATAQTAEPAAAYHMRLTDASAHAQGRLRPSLEALSALMRQRVGADFQRRVEDIKATHERMRRERPTETNAIAAALDHELASLAEVYRVEVEARLESVVRVLSPMARVTVATASGDGLTLTVDVGRGVMIPLSCAICKGDVSAGSVCERGHVICAEHNVTCAHCGAIHCPVCERTPLATCALCGDPTCSACAGACDTCGRTFCALHTWRCAEGDHTLCLEHLNVCGACGDALCDAHTSRCGACGAVRCQRDIHMCKTCGEARCADHAATCVACGQALCATHQTGCEQCGQVVCAEDVFGCLGCGRSLCNGHSPAACAVCGADYCVDCRGASGVCPACRALEPLTEQDVRTLNQAAEREPDIQLKRKWLVGRNAGARVFIARGLGREEAWVVTHGGEVIGARRKGWLAR